MKCIKIPTVIAAMCALTFLNPALTHAAPQQDRADQNQVKTINDMCPIGKEPIVPSAGTVEYTGHTVGVCCPGCKQAFLAWDTERKDEFVRLALADREPGMDTHSQAQDRNQPASTQPEEIKSDPYLLDTCPVSGQKLGSMGDPIVKTYDGREVKFCCAGCVGRFETEKDKYFAEIDKKMIEQQLPYYPLETCVVMDEELGSMGEPINHIYKNRLIRFCCKMCIKEFNENPKAYLEKIDKAIIEQQSEHYPLDTCAVMDNSKLGSMGEPVQMVVASRLVQFCCAGCKPAFEKDPAKYIARLDKAWKESDHMPGAAKSWRPDNDRGHEGHGHDGDHDHGDHDHGHGHDDDGHKH